jgi:hypothetical protein
VTAVVLGPTRPSSVPRPAPAPARALLLVLAVVGTLGSLASTAVPSDLAGLVAHAQRGDVRVVQVVATDASRGLSVRLGSAPHDEAVLWLDRYGVRHEARLLGLPARPQGTDDPDVVATVLAAAPPDARPRVVEQGGLLRDQLDRVGSGVLLVLLLLLVVGPQPRRATKWGWAWLLLLLPAGLGALLLLSRDAPWSRASTAEPAPADRHDRAPGVRTSGGTLFVLLLGLALLLTGLRGVAGGLEPSATPAAYDVLHADGWRTPGPLLPG